MIPNRATGSARAGPRDGSRKCRFPRKRLGTGYSFPNRRCEETLAEARRLDWDGDFRIPLFVAASYGQLGRAPEAAPALAEFQTLWTLPVEDLRTELIERHAIAPALADRLIAGLAKAGLEDLSGS